MYDDKAGLVPLSEEHVPYLTRWINEPAVVHHLDVLGGLAPEQERAFVERMRSSEHDFVFIISLNDNGGHRAIGTVGLHSISQRNRNCEFGILIGEKSEWGLGYGTAACRLICDFAFNNLNLHRVWLRVLDFNARGIASYKKVGFVEEGRQRQAVHKDDRYCDLLIMGLLRDEFNERWSDWRAQQRRRYGLPGSDGEA